MIGLDFQTLAPALAERLLNTAVEGIAVAGLVWVLLRLLGRPNSRIRFSIWFSSLLAVVALPLFAGQGLGVFHSQYISTANLRPEITLSNSWASSLLAVWGVIAGLLLLRLGVGLWRVRLIRKRGSEVNLASVDPAIARILQEAGSYRSVKLCISNDISVPAAIGFFRPAIVFPSWLLPQLSGDEIKVILLHELAHLRRWDDWTNLVQKIAKAVFFFYPAVWWIENHLALEREMACDDMVLAETSNPRDYASSLISFAEKLQNARCLALAQAFVSRMRHMSLRVAQILSAERTAEKDSWKPLLGAGAAMVALVVGAAPYAPQLVGFASQRPQIHSAHFVTDRANTDNGGNSIAATRVEQNFAGQQARAIPAVFTTRTTTAAFAPLKIKPRRNPGMVGASTIGTRMVGASMISTKTVRKEVVPQETFLILQTTRYDASGSGVWTLCIWKIRGGTLAERQLESAILMSSI